MKKQHLTDIKNLEKKQIAINIYTINGGGSDTEVEVVEYRAGDDDIL
ncbi:hypothetical protein [Kordia jejudonensis]|nr:hypothetical protein [Kordia jejudonensis]